MVFIYIYNNLQNKYWTHNFLVTKFQVVSGGEAKKTISDHVKTAKLSTIFIHLHIIQPHPMKQRSSYTASHYVFVDENGSNALQT